MQHFIGTNQFKECFNIKNLQLLWAEDNIKKAINIRIIYRKTYDTVFGNLKVQ